MYIRYNYVWTIGKNYHRVEIYNGYTKEQGLVGEPVIIIENSRFVDVMKRLKDFNFSKDVKSRLKSLAKEHIDGIISPNNEFLKH